MFRGAFKLHGGLGFISSITRGNVWFQSCKKTDRVVDIFRIVNKKVKCSALYPMSVETLAVVIELCPHKGSEKL